MTCANCDELLDTLKGELRRSRERAQELGVVLAVLAESVPIAIDPGGDCRTGGALLAVMNSDEYIDQPPREVYGSLLSRGEYYCSWRTMYRVLSEQGPVRDRRDQREARFFAIPRLEATAPNVVWTWDISKIPTCEHPGTPIESPESAIECRRNRDRIPSGCRSNHVGKRTSASPGNE